MTNRREFLAGAGVVSAALASATGSARAEISESAPPALPDDWNAVSQDFDRAQQIYQSLYDVDRSIANFDNAYYGVMTRTVHAEYLDRLAFVNRYNSMFLRGALPAGYVRDEQLDLARTRIGELLGCGYDEIALCNNGTEALYALITNYLGLTAGDSVIYADVDYPEMQYAMEYLRDSRGANVVRFALPDPATTANILAAYEDVLERAPRPKLLLLTHLSNRNGLVPPVAEIVRLAKARGVDVILDSAQTVGHLDFSLADTGADFVGFSLHKWVGNPLGTGAIYVRKERLADIGPYLGNQVYGDDDVRARVLSGTCDFAARLTLPFSLAEQQHIGMPAKSRHLLALRNYWVDRVRDVPGVEIAVPDEPGRFGAVTSFRLGGMRSYEQARQVQALFLQKYGVLVVARQGLEGGAAVRVAPGLYNTTEELDRLVTAIETEHGMFIERIGSARGATRNPPSRAR